MVDHVNLRNHEGIWQIVSQAACQHNAIPLAEVLLALNKHHMHRLVIPEQKVLDRAPCQIDFDLLLECRLDQLLILALIKQRLRPIKEESGFLGHRFDEFFPLGPFFLRLVHQIDCHDQLFPQFVFLFGEHVAIFLHQAPHWAILLFDCLNTQNLA
jgi:hypothetical protein